MTAPQETTRGLGGTARSTKDHHHSTRGLLKSKDAAAYLSVSPRTLFSLASSGAIRRIKIGPKMVRFDVAELDRWIADGCPTALPGGDS